MSSFAKSYLQLANDIQQDMIMIPIQQLQPSARALKVLEEMDSLIDHDYERHTNNEFVKKLVTDAMLKM
ncbi:hypothetical protein DV532_25730 (plasmid) [Pseudomonas sp. Leaf58]|uniref:hypothetical protein n=1 Tax=Pseudomonas TaxID=286 RepID=UPI0006F291EA|nr:MULTISPECIES: hypothetical protein [Pseudomonas]AYG47698.1 hypothetical protein DV532_25730 [Pseudomonas sp. Leaf58]KQN62741.1 hypothetical protein ASF02_11390 [Pseudomonas sp. Leaf58]MDT8925013.1 hypothetical protein [Pseudomonas taiwanensis]